MEQHGAWEQGPSGRPVLPSGRDAVKGSILKTEGTVRKPVRQPFAGRPHGQGDRPDGQRDRPDVLQLQY
jgi:hypothetical protein